MNTIVAPVTPEIVAGPCLLRPWREEDIPALVRYANNRNIWRNVGRGFPHPYTEAVAREWIATARSYDPEKQFTFAIEYEGEAIGSAGYERLNDVFSRTAQIGYWIGEPFWKRGVATTAVSALTRHLFENPDILRCQALVYAWNPASARVLEKAGYVCEARLKNTVYKDGQVTDHFIYGKLRP